MLSSKSNVFPSFNQMRRQSKLAGFCLFGRHRFFQCRYLLLDPLLCGGPVTSKGVEWLMGEVDVDRSLVGGPSLDADPFSMISNGAKDVCCKKQVSYWHVNKGGVHWPSCRCRRRLPRCRKGKRHADHNHCILLVRKSKQSYSTATRPNDSRINNSKSIIVKICSNREVEGVQ